LSFLIEDRWGIMMSLALRSVVRLGVILNDNVLSALTRLALGGLVYLVMLLSLPAWSVLLGMRTRWKTRLLESFMVIHMV
jgi:hypothetical protein